MSAAAKHHLSDDEALARRLQLEDELRHADAEFRDLELARQYARMDLQQTQVREEGVPQMPNRHRRALSLDTFECGSTRHLEQYLDSYPPLLQDDEDPDAGGGLERIGRLSSFDSRSASTRHLEQDLENHPRLHREHQDAYAGGRAERRGSHHRSAGHPLNSELSGEGSRQRLSVDETMDRKPTPAPSSTGFDPGTSSLEDHLAYVRKLQERAFTNLDRKANEESDLELARRMQEMEETNSTRQDNYQPSSSIKRQQEEEDERYARFIAETGDSSAISLTGDLAVRMQKIEARNKEIKSSREYDTDEDESEVSMGDLLGTPYFGQTASRSPRKEINQEDVDARLARYMEEGGDSIRALTDDRMMSIIGDSDKKKKCTSPVRQRTSPGSGYDQYAQKGPPPSRTTPTQPSLSKEDEFLARFMAARGEKTEESNSTRKNSDQPSSSIRRQQEEEDERYARFIAEGGDSTRSLTEDFAVRMQKIEARNKEIKSSREYDTDEDESEVSMGDLLGTPYFGQTASRSPRKEINQEDVDARLARYMEEGGDSIRALTDDRMMSIIGDSDKKKKCTSPVRQRTSPGSGYDQYAQKLPPSETMPTQLSEPLSKEDELLARYMADSGDSIRALSVERVKRIIGGSDDRERGMPSCFPGHVQGKSSGHRKHALSLSGALPPCLSDQLQSVESPLVLSREPTKVVANTSPVYRGLPLADPLGVNLPPADPPGVNLPTDAYLDVPAPIVKEKKKMNLKSFLGFGRNYRKNGDDRKSEASAPSVPNSPASIPPPSAASMSVPSSIPPPPGGSLSAPATIPGPLPHSQTMKRDLSRNMSREAPAPSVPNSPASIPPPPAANMSVPSSIPPPPGGSMSVPATIPGPLPHSQTMQRDLSRNMSRVGFGGAGRAPSICCTCHRTGGTQLVALERTYHAECFLCVSCNIIIDHTQPFAYTTDLQGKMHPHHRKCFAESLGIPCAVCRQVIPAGPDGTVSYVKHPFFDTEQMCPRHAENPGRRCTGCHRFEPENEPFVDLNDAGRRLCYACCRSVVMDNNDVRPLWSKILSFLEKTLKLPIWEEMREIPILVVGHDAMNNQMQQNVTAHGGSTQILTRGLCLTEHENCKLMKIPAMKFDESSNSFTGTDIAEKGFEYYDIKKASKANPNATVFAILCLSGLPRDLTASILAHEATHAWVKLHPKYNARKPLPLQVEEGCAQLIAMLFLNDGLDPPSASTQDNDGDGPSDEKLRQYFRFCIETEDNDIYGTGYRKAAGAYSVIGIEALLSYVVRYGDFPVT